MRPVLAMLLLALTACEQPATAPAEQSTPSPVASASADATRSALPPYIPPPNIPMTDLAALVGEYRVAGAGGREIDLPHAITARIDDSGILFESDCVQLSWAWFFEGSRLVTEQLSPRASCGRALLPEEEAIVSAINGATAIGRTPANGIEIGGRSGAVLLFGQ